MPFPFPGDLPNSEIEPASPAFPELAGRFFTTWATWKDCKIAEKACNWIGPVRVDKHQAAIYMEEWLEICVLVEALPYTSYGGLDNWTLVLSEKNVFFIIFKCLFNILGS